MLIRTLNGDEYYRGEHTAITTAYTTSFIFIIIPCCCDVVSWAKSVFVRFCGVLEIRFRTSNRETTTGGKGDSCQCNNMFRAIFSIVSRRS